MLQDEIRMQKIKFKKLIKGRERVREEESGGRDGKRSTRGERHGLKSLVSQDSSREPMLRLGRERERTQATSDRRQATHPLERNIRLPVPQSMSSLV